MKTRTERNTEDIDIITNDSNQIYDNKSNGIKVGAVRIDNCMVNNKDKPIVWRGIKRVPFARWDDFIEKTEDEWGKI